MKRVLVKTNSQLNQVMPVRRAMWSAPLSGRQTPPEWL